MERDDQFAGSLSEHQFIEFFEVEPQLDTCSESREFFGTRTFVRRWEETQLDFSVDPYTPAVTLELFTSGRSVLVASFEVESMTTTMRGESRQLTLRTIQGTSVVVGLPRISIKVYH